MSYDVYAAFDDVDVAVSERLVRMRAILPATRSARRQLSSTCHTLRNLNGLLHLASIWTIVIDHASQIDYV